MPGVVLAPRLVAAEVLSSFDVGVFRNALGEGDDLLIDGREDPSHVHGLLPEVPPFSGVVDEVVDDGHLWLDDGFIDASTGAQLGIASGKSCWAACGSPCSMADRIRVTSVMGAASAEKYLGFGRIIPANPARRYTRVPKD